MEGYIAKVLIPKNLDDEDDRDFQEEMIYYTSIVILQDNIDSMIEKNGKRAKLYQWALILFLILFTAVASFIASIL